MGSGSQDDLIAKIKLQFSDSELRASLEDVKAGLKQLGLTSNDALKSDMLLRYVGDLKGLVTAVQGLGEKWRLAGEGAQAFAVVSEQALRSTQAQAIAAAKTISDANKQSVADIKAAISYLEQNGKGVGSGIKLGDATELKNAQTVLEIIGRLRRQMTEEAKIEEQIIASSARTEKRETQDILDKRKEITAEETRKQRAFQETVNFIRQTGGQTPSFDPFNPAEVAKIRELYQFIGELRLNYTADQKADEALQLAAIKEREQEETASEIRIASVAKEAASSQAQIERELHSQEMANAEALRRAKEQIAREVLASQKSLFTALQSGASGNLSGMVSGVWQQAMSGQLPAGLSGGINGILGAGGGGLAKTLGLDASFAPMIGGAVLGIGALGVAVKLVGDEYIDSYGKSQTMLQGMRMIQKEIGTTASQTSKLVGMMSLTQNPDSPFSAIIFSQVQANLQNLVDAQNGVSSMNAGGMAGGQIQKMADGLQRLGVSAKDAAGNAKDVVQFAIDMSKAVQGMDPARYSQVIQEIGGLFGKDFAAVIGTAPDDLKRLTDSSVQVTQAQLKMADSIKISYQIANNAQKQFELNLTYALTPLDMTIQKTKELTFNVLAYATTLSSTKTPGEILLQTAKLAFENAFDSAAYAADVAAAKKAQTDQIVADGKTQEEVLKTTQRATADYKYDLQLLNDVYKDGKEAQKQYDQGLKDMTGDLTAAGKAMSELKTLNLGGLSSFGSTVSGVVSGAKGYDSYYKSYRDKTGEVDKLDKLANQNISYTQYKDPVTGDIQTPTGSTKDIKAYIDGIAKYNAWSEDQVNKNAAKIAKIDLNEANATARASAPRTSTSTTKKYGTVTKTTPGPGLSASAALGYDQQREAITGDDPMARYYADKENNKVGALAAKAGFAEGFIPTTENIVTSWGKRGLDANEIERRTAALEALKDIDMSNKESQFEQMRKSAEGYLKTMAEQDPTLLKAGEGQQRFNDAEREMAEGLQNFAQSAGLFNSAGFSRSMGEATLAAKLANGEFGKGPGAIQAYYDAFGKFQTGMEGLKDYLSGSENLTVEDATKFGLVKEDTTVARDALKLGKKMAKLGEGDLSIETLLASGKEGQNARLLDRIDKKQVTPGEVASLFAQSQGIDTTTGVMNVFDQTIGKTLDKAKGLAKTADDEITAILDKAHELRVVISPDSKEAIAAQLAALGLIPAAGATAVVTTANAGVGRLGTQGFKTLEEIKAYGDQKTLESKSPDFKVADIYRSLYGGHKDSGGGDPNASPLLKGDMMTVDAALNIPPKNVEEFERQAKEAITKAQTDTVDPNPLKHKSIMDMILLEKVLPAQLQSMHDILQLQADAHPVYFKAIVTGAPGAPAPAPTGGENVNPPPPPLPIKGIGGSVFKDSPVWVGETGRPELFWPGQDGYITDAITSNKFVNRNNYERPVNTRQPITINTDAPQNNISIDARGSSSPLAVSRAVREVAENYISDDPRIIAQWAQRRKGRFA